MPVTAEVGRVLRHDDEVALTRLDHAFAPGAQVLLARRVGLNRGDDLYPERTAHSTRARVMRTVPITKAMSTAVFRCVRNGLKPMSRW